MTRIALGISGGIAAYKTPELIRLFGKSGVEVVSVLTRNACRFVTPHALAAVSHQPVFEQMFDGQLGSPHLEIAREIDALVVAPASASALAKFANGFADDLLSTLFLTFEGPKIVAPAMHTEMLASAAVQDNLKRLSNAGVVVLGPAEGDLAFGDYGMGRLVDLSVIVSQTRALLLPNVPCLNGKHIVITAGGTEAPIDSVRVVTNRSTGMLGHTLANLAAAWGATVTLITSKPEAYSHPNITVTPVRTPDDLIRELDGCFSSCDTLVMAAAVSDFSFSEAPGKLSRSGPVLLEGRPTPDILAMFAAKKNKQQIVGFCLEPKATLAQRAREKLVSKNADIIVANSEDSIGAETREAMLFYAGGPDQVVQIPPLPLFEFSAHLLQSIYHDKL